MWILHNDTSYESRLMFYSELTYAAVDAYTGQWVTMTVVYLQGQFVIICWWLDRKLPPQWMTPVTQNCCSQQQYEVISKRHQLQRRWLLHHDRRHQGSHLRDVNIIHHYHRHCRRKSDMVLRHVPCQEPPKSTRQRCRLISCHLLYHSLVRNARKHHRSVVPEVLWQIGWLAKLCHLCPSIMRIKNIKSNSSRHRQQSSNLVTWLYLNVTGGTSCSWG